MEHQLLAGTAVDGTCSAWTLFIAMLTAMIPKGSREKERLATLENEKMEAENFKQRIVYDFVVVGGGTAGSVVASRLSENPSWSVLVLEAGCEEVALNDLPVFGLATNYECLWNYTPEANPRINGGFKEPFIGGSQIHPARVLGGGSTVNGMVYNRGSRGDYDKWVREVGDPSWSFDNVLPYFKKSEGMTDSVLARDTRCHSTTGPLGISVPNRTADPIHDILIQSLGELGYPEVDENAGEIGASVPQFTIRNGLRSSADRAFLEPARSRPNLDVRTHSRVTKIIICPSSRRALGVQYIDSDGTSHTIYAEKEVIVSAGAIESPHLLMVSGVGPAEDLTSFRIPVVQDLPVGRGLRDHLFLPSPFQFTVSNNPPSLAAIIEQWIDYVNTASGPFSQPSDPAVLFKVLSNPSRPDMEYIFSRVYDDESCPTPVRDNMFYNVLLLSTFYLHPKSIGQVRLRDSDPLSNPIIDLNILAHPDDLAMAKRGLKSIADLRYSQVLRNNGIIMKSTPYPGCEQKFSDNFPSDQYLDCVVRTAATTGYHYVGSCAMGRFGSKYSVVDTNMKVHGINELRVVDASVIPFQMSGHPNGVVIMVAEKASDIIKSAWSGWK